MNKRGFIGTIVVVIVALIILGYLNIDIQSVISSPKVEGNIQYAWGLVVKAFNTLKDIVLHIVLILKK